MEEGSRWWGEKNIMKSALKDAELLDKNDKLHDWNKHGLKLILSSRKRQKRYRDTLRNANVTVTSTSPSLFHTSHTSPSNQKQIGWFLDVWAQYPKKKGKSKAQEHFVASVKTEEDLQNIRKALSNYLSSQRVKGGFIQDGSRWFKFKEWQDWIEYVEKGGPNASTPKSGVAGEPGKYAKIGS